MSILKFTVIHKKELLGSYGYAALKVNSNSFIREFFIEGLNIEQPLEMISSTISINVNYTNKYNSVLHLVDFELYVTDIEKAFGGTNISGIVRPNSHFENYEQEIINVLNSWQKGIEIEWDKLNTTEKHNYISCCGYWSGLTKKIPLEKYRLDCSLIKEELDFFILLGEVLVGKRGYFGDYLYTLEDCLRELHNENQHHITLEFFNYEILKNSVGDSYFDDIIKLFNRYNFDIKLI